MRRSWRRRAPLLCRTLSPVLEENAPRRRSSESERSRRWARLMDELIVSPRSGTVIFGAGRLSDHRHQPPGSDRPIELTANPRCGPNGCGGTGDHTRDLARSAGLLGHHTGCPNERRRSALPPKRGPKLGLMLESIPDYAIYMLDRDERCDRGIWAPTAKGYRARRSSGRFSIFFTPEDKGARAFRTALCQQARREGLGTTPDVGRKDGRVSGWTGVVERSRMRRQPYRLVKVARKT